VIDQAGFPAAVLWDMDGTLVDTEPYWIECEYELVAEHGGRWSTEHAHAVVGNDLVVTAGYLREHGSVLLDDNAIIARLLDGVIARVREHVPWRPGARELLEDLHAHGVPCGLVTMSYRAFADAVIAALPSGRFATVVTGDEVTRGKPHPEPYLAAARDLGVHPPDCVAIEDSPIGAASAEAAGMPVIAVQHLVPIPPASGRVMLSSLAGVRAEHLVGLLRGDRPQDVQADGADGRQDRGDHTGDGREHDHDDQLRPGDREHLQALADQAVLQGDPEAEPQHGAEQRAEHGGGHGLDGDRR
jgi:HAD superfamily hydrolase (TIGR01509 family)